MLHLTRRIFRAALSIAPSFVALTAFAAVPPHAVGASSSNEIHDRPLCVLSVEPQMHLLSLAAPDTKDGSTISLFLSNSPGVAAGDLIRLSRKEGATESHVELIERAAKKCADLVARAAHHHEQEDEAKGHEGH